MILSSITFMSNSNKFYMYKISRFYNRNYNEVKKSRIFALKKNKRRKSEILLLGHGMQKHDTEKRMLQSKYIFFPRNNKKIKKNIRNNNKHIFSIKRMNNLEQTKYHYGTYKTI